LRRIVSPLFFVGTTELVLANLSFRDVDFLGLECFLLFLHFSRVPDQEAPFFDREIFLEFRLFYVFFFRVFKTLIFDVSVFLVL